MSIYPPILLGRTIIAPKMPPSDKKGYLYKKNTLSFRKSSGKRSECKSRILYLMENSNGQVSYQFVPLFYITLRCLIEIAYVKYPHFNFNTLKIWRFVVFVPLRLNRFSLSC